MKYPSRFYTAHAEFPTLKGRPWGSLTDGPCGFDEALDSVCQHYVKAADGTPSRDNLRVWLFEGREARDVTDAFALYAAPGDDDRPTREAIAEMIGEDLGGTVINAAAKFAPSGALGVI